MKRWLQTMRHVLGGSRTRPEAGYTIMEIIIVLAVSTMILSAAIIALQGRQSRVEFTQAVRNYEARLQNIISDVTKGYFPTGYRCSVATGAPVVTDTPVPGGTNEGCIFLGKIIATNPNGGDVLTIVGRRLDDDGNDISDYVDAEPTAVRGITVDLTETFVNEFGLEITKVLKIGTNVGYANFGFIHQLSGGAVVGGSAAKSVLLYGKNGHNVSVPTDTAATTLAQYEPVSEGLLICLLGANGQRAEIRLGEDNSQTTITSTLDTPNTGACS